MENQQQATATALCRGGCGFYGSSATEGLCSKCFKDSIKRKQDTARLSPTNLSSPSQSEAKTISDKLREAVKNSELFDVAKALCSPEAASSTIVGSSSTSSSQAASVETVALEASSCTLTSGSSPASAVQILDAAMAASVDMAVSAPPTKKPNRCLQCKKRVGLTGFTCRCGGLYCGEHRYDKAHNCEFDYKTMEREEIRKNNPVVVSDKIQRI